ncbi:MAG: autotransporter outer membrane beta-barrel domain-containing protein [Gammaproteobacteria bacterium]|nr:autotransporter outer membrane beta-barrel domain-containing protein [Gammaproteobacteria bacterium]
MNSGIGNSAETAPPFVSFGFTFRGLARGCAAACLFGLVLLLGATQALAQTSVSLVSNINQAINSRTSVFQDVATQFVTGSHAQGYKLTSVDLKVREALSVPHTVEIRSSVEDSTPGRLQNGNQRHYPGTLVGTLTNPASLTANADNNYKASGSGIDLEPETSYWLVIDHTPSGSGDGSNFELTESTNETALSGWSISQGIETRAYSESGSSWDYHPHDDNVSLMFTIKGYEKSSRTYTTTDLLATVGMQALTGALENIGGRFSDSLPQTNLNIAGLGVSLTSGSVNSALYEPCRFNCDELSDLPRYRNIDASEILPSGAFSLGLGATEGQADSLATQWSVWGRADASSFDIRPAPGAYHDGKAQSGWLGIDARSDSWVAGVALSNFSSKVDYRVNAAGAPARLETRLTTVYPYGRWEFDEQSELHAIIGIGSGEVRNVGTADVREQSDLSMQMLSLGMKRQLKPLAGGMELSARADASMVRLKTEAGEQSIDGLKPESWRIRMGLEGSKHIRQDDGTALTPFFELVVRHDGGDGLNGMGLELAGGMRYRASRVQVEVRGRTLLTHSDQSESVRENGLSLSLRYLPETDGGGLSLSLRPHWGIATDSAAALWQDEMPQPSSINAANSFNARIGYGFILPPTGGVLTPFAEASHAEEGDSRVHRIGARFERPRDHLAIQLFGERRERAADTTTADSIRFEFSYQF